MLIATDEKGCKDTIVKPIKIIEAHYVYVPNTFTPDGNRLNNVFSASVFGVNTLGIQIFNRWGELVFESNNPRFEWDGTYQGKLCADGTYTWKIIYAANSGLEEKLVGHVNLLK
jgi:gliding motility-associated-like protein